MSEIYKNSTHYAFLDIIGGVADTQPEAVCHFGSTDRPLTVSVEDAPEEGTERWSAHIDLPCTQSVGEIYVDWSFAMGGDPVSKRDYFDVVVPLTQISTIFEEIPDLEGTVTIDELARAERKVRNYIENYTGQVFASTTETIKVASDGLTFALPKRLISVTTLDSAVVASTSYEINNEGWDFKLGSPYPDTDISYSNPITAPVDIKSDIAFLTRSRRINRTLSIEGLWGWNRPPQAVQEATLILIEDFLSPDTVYRDKYLASLTSPDWRIQFHSGAFRGSGNVRVDQLLQEYVVKNRWVVV